MKLPLHQIIDYAMTKSEEVDEAYRQFFGSLAANDLEPEWESLFLEWLIYDYQRIDRSSFLIEYILINPDQLNKTKLDQLQQVSQSHLYSLFEIQKVNPGVGLVLEDIFTGKVYRVREKLGSKTLQAPGTIPCRLAQINKIWYLVGTNPVYFPISHTSRAKTNFKNAKLPAYSPKDTAQLLINQKNKPSPPPPELTKKQILAKRKNLARSYAKKSQQYQVTLSFQELIREVYLEDRVNVLDFWTALTEKGLTEEFFVNHISIMQDIWNYFPHKCLNDLSPVELYAHLKNTQ